MNEEKWLTEYGRDLKGMRIAVTGATGSIGRELCRILGRLGAELILACRNAERGESLKKSLDEVGVASRVFELDVSSRRSIDAFCERVEQECGHVDILFHNAGIYHLNRTENEEGMEIHYATNFWGPCYLTHRMLPLMRNGKVIFMSSIAYRFCRLDPTDIQSKGRAGSTLVYARTKRLLMLAAERLAEEGQKYGVSVAIAHPGISPTEMLSSKKGFSGAFQAMIVPLMKLIFPSPQKASLAGVLAVCGGCVGNVWAGPRILGIWGRPRFYPFCRNFTAEERACNVENLYRSEREQE